MNYDFDWGMLVEKPFFEWILNALLTTVHLALLSWVIAVAIGVVVGAFRVTQSRALRFIGTTYVEVFRRQYSMAERR